MKIMTSTMRLAFNIYVNISFMLGAKNADDEDEQAIERKRGR